MNGCGSAIPQNNFLSDSGRASGHPKSTSTNPTDSASKTSNVCLSRANELAQTEVPRGRVSNLFRALCRPVPLLYLTATVVMLAAVPPLLASGAFLAAGVFMINSALCVNLLEISASENLDRQAAPQFRFVGDQIAELSKEFNDLPSNKDVKDIKRALSNIQEVVNIKGGRAEGSIHDSNGYKDYSPKQLLNMLNAQRQALENLKGGG